MHMHAPALPRGISIGLDQPNNLHRSHTAKRHVRLCVSSHVPLFPSGNASDVGVTISVDDNSVAFVRGGVVKADIFDGVILKTKRQVILPHPARFSPTGLWRAAFVDPSRRALADWPGRVCADLGM